jgi:transcriptional regulator with XRE-family HTH domain
MPFDSQHDFCAALKAARQRKGLTLADIAASTKVCPSYFSALERNDLGSWPKGLFRRSFFRAYVGMIGLPAEEMVAEFVRLFPEDERAAAVAPAAAASEVRLVLDESWKGPRMPLGLRLGAAALDLLAVTVPSAIAAWALPIGLPAMVAIAAVTYFTLATLVLGESPAAFCLERRTTLIDALLSLFPAARMPEAPAGEVRDDREWTTDARRVRPRGQAPGLRVRFKVSS